MLLAYHFITQVAIKEMATGGKQDTPEGMYVSKAHTP